MTADFSDFDRYCDEHGISESELPMAFAAWLHEISGGEWEGEAHEVRHGAHVCARCGLASEQHAGGREADGCVYDPIYVVS